MIRKEYVYKKGQEHCVIIAEDREICVFIEETLLRIFPIFLSFFTFCCFYVPFSTRMRWFRFCNGLWLWLCCHISTFVLVISSIVLHPTRKTHTLHTSESLFASSGERRKEKETERWRARCVPLFALNPRRLPQCKYSQYIDSSS